MSLIVCGSQQQEYGDINDEGLRAHNKVGIERPANFQNHMVNPVKVKPNSEVAVHSVKINRSPLFDINNKDVFYLYFGELLSQGTAHARLYDVNSIPIPIRMRPGTYGATGLANEIEQQLNTQYQHPDIFGNHHVDVLTNASFGVDGFKIDLDQRGSADGKNANNACLTGDKDDEWQPWVENCNLEQRMFHREVLEERLSDLQTGSSNFTTDKVAFTPNASVNVSSIFMQRDVAQKRDDKDDWNCVGIMANGSAVMPLGACEAKFTVDFSQVVEGNQFTVGLTRPTMYIPNVGGQDTNRVDEKYLQGGPQDNCDLGNWDYACHYDGVKLRLYSSGLDGDLPKTSSQNRSFGCHEFTPLVEVPTAEMWGNGSKISVIEFESFGEMLECSVYNASHSSASKVLLAEFKVASSLYDENFTPKNECKNALYPKLMLTEDNDAFNIIKWEAHDQFGFRYPTKALIDAGATGKMWKVDPGDSFWANSFWANARQFDPERGYRDDTEENTLYGQAAIDSTTCIVPRFYGWRERAGHLCQPVLGQDNQAWLSDSNLPQRRRTGTAIRGVELNANDGVDYNSILIVGQQVRADDRGGDYPTAPLTNPVGTYTYNLTGNLIPSMETTLGFRGRPVLHNAFSTETANENLIQYQSSVAPYYNPHACFVRWSNGPQTSFNANKSSVSKIIYPLPRFDNSGNTFGDLFFEANERTYLDLNNTAEINLQNMDLQLVDINEKPVQDLVGQTLITLHIRQKL